MFPLCDYEHGVFPSSVSQAEGNSAAYDMHSTIAGPSPSNWMNSQPVYDPTAASQAVYNPAATSQAAYNPTAASQAVYNPTATSQAVYNPAVTVSDATMPQFMASQYGYDATSYAAAAANAQQTATSEDLRAFLEYQKYIAAASQTAALQSYPSATGTQVSYQQPSTDIQTHTDFQQAQQQQQMNLLYSQQLQQQTNLMHNQLAQSAVPQAFISPSQQSTFVSPIQQPIFASPAQQPAYVGPFQQPTFTSPTQQQTLAVPAQQQPFASHAQQQTLAAPVQQQTFPNLVQQQTFVSPLQQQAYVSAVQQPGFVSPQTPVQQPGFTSPVQQPSAAPAMQQPLPVPSSSSTRPPFVRPTQRPWAGSSPQTTRTTQRFTNFGGREAMHARGHSTNNTRGPRPSPPWSNRPRYDGGTVVRTTYIQPSRVRGRAPMERNFAGNPMAGLTMEVNRYSQDYGQSGEMLRKKNEVRMILEQAVQDRVSKGWSRQYFPSNSLPFGPSISFIVDVTQFVCISLFTLFLFYF